MSRAWRFGVVALLAACAPTDDVGSEAMPAVRVRQAQDVSVPMVAWAAPEGQLSRVVAEDAEGGQVATEWVEGTGAEWDQVLLGLAAGTAYRAWGELEDGTTFGETEFTTDPLPAGFAEWTTEGSPGWRGWMLTALLGTLPRPALLDEHGRVSWYGPQLPNCKLVRSAFRPEGDGVWSLIEYMDPKRSELVATSWTGEELERWPAAGWSHDFVPLSNGEMFWIQNQCVNVDGVGRVCADAVMRGTPGSGNDPVRVWAAMQTFDPATDGTVLADGDWSHANALDHVEGSGVLHLGLRGFSAILDIDAGTGEVVRQLGGPHATHTPTDADASFDSQHQFQFYGDDHVVIHDNRDSASGSRILTLRVDDEAGTVSTESIIEPGNGVWDFVLGDVDRSSAGTLVTWSTAGLLVDYAPDGTERWRATSALGTAFAYTTRSNDLPGMAAAEPLE